MFMITTSVGDPGSADPDPRIFTGIRIRRSGIRDTREKKCGSPTLSISIVFKLG